MTRCKDHTGWSVQITYRPPMEDMFETLTHRVVFQFRHEAQALARRIQKAMCDAFPFTLQPLNVEAEWLWSPSLASPLGFMHKPPAAEKVYREGKPLPYTD